jgi:hypothetical protein
MLKSQYYSKKVLSCPCCKKGYDNVNPRLIELLDQLHDLAGINLKLGDVYRCPAYNAQLGKSKNSQHVQGKAALIKVPDELTAEELIFLCEQLPFDSIGLVKQEDQTYIEVDVRNGGIGSKIRWES